MKRVQTTYTNEVTYTVDEETLLFKFYDSKGQRIAMYGATSFPYNVFTICHSYGNKANRYKNFYKTHGVLPTNFFKIIKGAFYKEIFLKYPESYKLHRRHTWTALSYNFYEAAKAEHLLQQCRKDNITNLIPIVAMLGKSPQVLSKEFPAHIWRSFCKNSYTKNKNIANVILHIGLFASFVAYDIVDYGLNELIKLPTSFLLLYKNLFRIDNIRAIH